MSDSAVQLFDSESGYRAAIDMTLAAARREVRVFDQDLVQMGLEEPARAALLTNFLAGGRDRRLRIVLHDIGPLERISPRLIGLMRLHGHAVEVRLTPEHLRQVADCWVLADESNGAIRFHVDHARGKLVLGAPAELRPWWLRFDELWLASEPCTPGAVAGL